jgi:hypothetical protein
MGGHVNYYRIIRQLVFLKDEFYRLEQEKYQDLINELSKYHIDPDSDNEHLPSHKTLAKDLNYSQTKMNRLIKDFHLALVTSFNDPPLIVNQYVHYVHIALPYDERKKGKQLINQNEYTWISVVLPVTPSAGDEISFPFMDETGNYERGYVHSVLHTINGKRQEIYIEVHPWNNFYYKWQKLKTDYENHKQWMQMMKLKYGE